MRRYRDLAAAEDAVQEALLAAATQWAREGLPDNPLAWLVRVASRRLTDQIRSDAARRIRESEAALQESYAIPSAEQEGEEEQLQRPDLAKEAIRLARLVYTKLPGNAEVA